MIVDLFIFPLIVRKDIVDRNGKRRNVAVAVAGVSRTRDINRGGRRIRGAAAAAAVHCCSSLYDAALRRLRLVLGQFLLAISRLQRRSAVCIYERFK